MLVVSDGLFDMSMTGRWSSVDQNKFVVFWVNVSAYTMLYLSYLCHSFGFMNSLVCRLVSQILSSSVHVFLSAAVSSTRADETWTPRH